MCPPPSLFLSFSFWISYSRRTDTATSRFWWLYGLRCLSAAALWLGSLVRIPLRAWMLVCCVWDELTTHSEFYQLGVSHYEWSIDLNNEATYAGVRLLQHVKTARTFACNLEIAVVVLHTTTLLFRPYRFLMCRLRILCVLYNPKTKGKTVPFVFC
jgi:hypothetical protein